MSEVVHTTAGERVAWVDRATRDLEQSQELDRLSDAVGNAARPFNQDGVASALRGDWLGHALHPLLTDVPMGCWMGSLFLDMMPGTRRASRRLIGVGLAAVPVTAAAGLAEWDTMRTQEERRVAAVHAVGNTLAAMAFGRSWQKRSGDRKAGGMMWSLVGGSLALVTGYLGGHLSFARQVGTGARGVPADVGDRAPLTV